MKKIACLCMALIMSLSIAIPASAVDFSAVREAEYYAVVEELNTKYDAKITLYNIPEGMSVEEFRETMTEMAISSARIKASLNTQKENGILPASVQATANNKTVNIGKTADAYVMLVCKNVIIGEDDKGDTIFLSAISDNMYPREAHPFLQTITYPFKEQHARIYDRGASLELSAVGDLTVRSDSTLTKIFEMDDYATQVFCVPSDTVWM